MITFNTFIPKYNNYSPRTTNKQFCGFNNLAPLKCDTVSFGSTKKTYSINDEKFGISMEEAENINKEAESTLKYFLDDLTDIFKDDLCKNSKDNKPIFSIHGRIKSKESIYEKSASRRWLNSDEVKSNMKDIVGARIILNDSSVENADYVINKITNAVKDNKLEIVEIENYRPEPDLDENGNIVNSYDYPSPNTLTKLKHICDKKFSYIQKRDEDVPSGYMAVHLITKLPNGYYGEIQIMGKEVEKLKNIEDICYKYKNGKSISNVYDDMRPLLEPLTNSNNPLFNKDYNEYTREAYKYQRRKELNNSIVKSPYFLKIPEHLPDTLDFNNLQTMEIACQKKNKGKTG